MRDAMSRFSPKRGWAALTLGLLLAGGGCGLEKVSEPALGGPADQGYSVDLAAQPDTINADGVSTCTVRLVVRDQNGEPVKNHSVIFTENGDGEMLPAPSFTYVGPVQTGIVMATDSAGTANVVYTAGTNIGTLTVSVRPYGIDAANAYERSVTIEQR
jgi:hypothetical protein